ncbi:MAG: DegT/DnrJ/EryC1/StrS family aminotransferase [Egibacteraceae bacterium]
MRNSSYTHLGHLRGHAHGVNYELAGPITAIGLRRLRLLDKQLDQRRRRAQRILRRLPPDGLLRELVYGGQDRPNCYSLVLTARDHAQAVAAGLASIGLPPDSIRHGYRPLYHQPIFQAYAAECQNAEALIAATVQLPVHPGMPEPTVEWVAGRVAAIARKGTRR